MLAEAVFLIGVAVIAAIVLGLFWGIWNALGKEWLEEFRKKRP